MLGFSLQPVRGIGQQSMPLLPRPFYDLTHLFLRCLTYAPDFLLGTLSG
ncbi:MAG: hypothetical protein ACRDWF_00165 [Acidimicrobiia bacterium]